MTAKNWEVGHLFCAREFGLVPVGAIIGVIHTVQNNSSILLVNENDMQAKRHHGVCDGVAGSKNQLFYVKRFFSEVSEEFDVADVSNYGDLLHNWYKETFLELWRV